MPSNDLTGKARIRMAALELFAAHGISGTSMRAIATRAGVTVGLVSHHFGTKSNLVDAVNTEIERMYRETIAAVPETKGDAFIHDLNAAVAALLTQHPEIVAYIRRTVLDMTENEPGVIDRLDSLTVEQLRSLRERGVVRTDQPLAEQVILVVMRQLGELILQPMAKRIVDSLPPEEGGGGPTPRLSISVRD